MCLTEVRGTQAGRRAQNALTKVSLAKVRSTETTINVKLLIYVYLHKLSMLKTLTEIRFYIKI